MNIKLLLLCLLMCITSAEARIKRSQSVKIEFRRMNPCPATGLHKGPCRGFVLDHVIPLACGGPDAASNLQWQSVADGKAKDKWERKLCAKSTRSK